MFTPSDFFDLTDFEHKALFEGDTITQIWKVLKEIDSYLEANLKPGIEGQVHPGAYLMDEQIYLAPGAVVEPGAYIAGPSYIGAGSVVRHGAYVRGGCIIGRNCVIGHATEVKHSVFLDGAKAAHFNYVGDSILGNNVNLGAGSRLANFKLRGSEVNVRHNGRPIPTGLRKFGAILGDSVSLGCNVVCNPGTIIGPHSEVFPLVSVLGYYNAYSRISE
jgi:NDP-sugar pyrophosphorylase family protein